MAGEQISIEDLARAIEDSFSGEQPDDFTFTNANLVDIDGRRAVFVPDVLPGGVSVVDANGFVVMPDQMECVREGVVIGIYVVLDGFLSANGMLQGTWKIRYNRGMRGMDGSSAGMSDASSNEMMLYSLIMG